MTAAMSGVFVTGIMNPKGSDNNEKTFALTERELDIIVASPANTTPLMVEHSYNSTESNLGMQRVGMIQTFWKDADGRLWGLAHIDPTLPMGTRALRSLLTNGFTGFSVGVPFDHERYRTRKEVLKLGLIEVSLVREPDHEGTVLVAVEGAQHLSAWANVEAAFRRLYSTMGLDCEEAALDFFFHHIELWSSITTSSANEQCILDRINESRPRGVSTFCA
jgi:hypothetical protein